MIVGLRLIYHPPVRFAWVGFMLSLSLAACVTPEELRREDETRCSGFGFHPGTDAFANCLQQESLARRYAISAAPPPYWGYWGYWGRGWDRIGLKSRSVPYGPRDRRVRSREVECYGEIPSTPKMRCVEYLSPTAIASL